MPPGQIEALLGVNGTGDTTTVRAIVGLLKTEGASVVTGSVKFLDQDVTNLDQHQITRRGLVFVARDVGLDATEADWLRAIDVNMKGAYFAAKLARAQG